MLYYVNWRSKKIIKHKILYQCSICFRSRSPFSFLFFFFFFDFQQCDWSSHLNIVTLQYWAGATGGRRDSTTSIEQVFPKGGSQKIEMESTNTLSIRLPPESNLVFETVLSLFKRTTTKWKDVRIIQMKEFPCRGACHHR
jgi:hypothetical protein